MKYLKRILPLLLIALFASLAFAATESTLLTVTVSRVNASGEAISSAAADDSFFVDVVLSGNPASAAESVQSFDFLLQYDPAKMTPVECTQGDYDGLFLSNLSFNDSTIWAGWNCTGGLAKSSSVLSEARLFRIEFTALAALTEADLKAIQPVSSAIGTTQTQKTHFSDAARQDFPYTVAGSGVSLSGTVTSYGTATNPVSIQLFADPADEAPAYETTVTGLSQAYQLSSIAAGTYTLKISKAGHAVYSEEITLTADRAGADYTLYLLGDINQDGALTSVDTLQLKRIVAKMDTPTAQQALIADIDNSGSISSTDTLMLKRLVAKILVLA